MVHSCDCPVRNHGICDHSQPYCCLNLTKLQNHPICITVYKSFLQKSHCLSNKTLCIWKHGTKLKDLTLNPNPRLTFLFPEPNQASNINETLSLLEKLSGKTGQKWILIIL